MKQENLYVKCHIYHGGEIHLLLTGDQFGAEIAGNWKCENNVISVTWKRQSEELEEWATVESFLTRGMLHQVEALVGMYLKDREERDCLECNKYYCFLVTVAENTDEIECHVREERLNRLYGEEVPFVLDPDYVVEGDE